MRRAVKHINSVIYWVLLLCSQTVFAMELEFQRHEVSEPKARVLWVTSEHGVTEGHRAFFQSLQKSDIELWQADPYSTWFLPVAESSLADMSIEAYIEWVQAALADDVPVLLVSHDKASQFMLQVAMALPESDRNRLHGAVLISPNVLSATPSPGESGAWADIARATNLPLYLFVPEKSTLQLRSEALMHVLSKAGSDVFLQSLPEVRDRFFFRPDASDTENKRAETLASDLIQAIQLLDDVNDSSRPVQSKVSAVEVKAKKTGRLVAVDKTYFESFVLPDLTDIHRDLNDYQQPIRIVNFWATWCPPCVHEMPSMNRLKAHFSGHLEIVAVNLGEAPETVKAFAKQYELDFPILLDPQKTTAKAWQVYAFPTSYVLNAEGEIVLAVAGGIDWMDGEVIEALQAMLQGKKSD